MVYLNIVMGLGVVLAAAAAIYFNMSNYQQTAPHRSRRRERSRPGDECPECSIPMRAGDMHVMQCGHAMDIDCYRLFLYRCRNNCPICLRLVNFTIAGDTCPICLETLHVADMVHLTCTHALHYTCLDMFHRNQCGVCPLCRASV
ncbi:hypothetical protein KR009_001189 [Drosophila setifemur]|nr:hypothetical protein KR009_001189 [Drosophila setifemur]